MVLASIRASLVVVSLSKTQLARILANAQKKLRPAITEKLLTSGELLPGGKCIRLLIACSGIHTTLALACVCEQGP